MPRSALITGITGQDGAYLAKLLLEKNYKVYGGIRRTSTASDWRLKYFNIQNEIELVDLDLIEYSNIQEVIKKIKPDELYNLAAQSFVAASFTQPIYTSEIDALGPLRILEALRQYSSHTKFYQASTSEMFGSVAEIPQTEMTRFHPRSPYGVAKQFGHWMTINYREAHNIHASAGILFNHESPLRGEEFVTRKITKAIAEIKIGKRTELQLGSLDAKRDWGYAGDFVEAMWLMLQQHTADDYVVATGKTTTVRSFIEFSCASLDLKIEWSGDGLDEIGEIIGLEQRAKVVINRKFYRPAEVDILLGSAAKAENILGWKYKTDVEELAKIMTLADLKFAT